MRLGIGGFSRGFLLLTLIIARAGQAHVSSAEQRAIDLQRQWSRALQGIVKSLNALEARMQAAGLHYDTTDVHRLLIHKLGPQAQMVNRPLVVGIMAAANSGKSTLANQLLGAYGDRRITNVSAIGGSTKLPLALLNPDFPETDIPLLFGGFTHAQQRTPMDATMPSPTGGPHLIWRKSPLVRESITIVDLPDIDSYHTENHLQTKALLDVADVVMAMVTDQYNQAPFVEMLKEVAKSKKKVILIFNKAHIGVHRKYWPIWIDELTRVCGIEVHGAFAIESDPVKAEVGDKLNFYNVGADGRSTPVLVEPMEALHNLQITKLRIRAELGALEQALKAETGLEAFQEEIKKTSQALGWVKELFKKREEVEALIDPTLAPSATETVTSQTAVSQAADGDEASLSETGDEEEPTLEALLAKGGVPFPSPPADAVGVAITDAFNKRYRGLWSKGFYWGPRLLRKSLAGLYKRADEADERAYRSEEYEFLRHHVFNRVYEELTAISQSPSVQGELRLAVNEALDGARWAEMLSQFREKHSAMNLVDSELRKAIEAKLEQMRQENKLAFHVLANADSAMVISELVSPVVVMTAGGYLVSLPFTYHWMAKIVSGWVYAGGSATTGLYATPNISVMNKKLLRKVATKAVNGMVEEYGHMRVRDTVQWLHDNYLKKFYAEVKKVAETTDSPEIAELDASISCARALVGQLEALQ
ncbi:50S ribosome-binding GTPase [bacterium]|nr:50S ribosome-binding GTPase [bacterium]